MATPKTVAFHTLGCKLNYSETSAIARLFEQQGYAVTHFTAEADIYVINTCSVTDFADRKCRKAVRQALRTAPNALIVVIGCYAQLKPQEIADIPGVDMVLGAAEKFRILDFVENLSKAPGKGMIRAGDIAEVNEFVEAFSFGDRTRSFLKVQDGCNYNCSFCTIPLARGKSRSNSVEKVVAAAEKIAGKGVKEIVLTGVNIGDFGYQPVPDKLGASLPPSIPGRGRAVLKAATFLDLIKELDTVQGIERFRISSIEPNLCTNDIIDFVSQSRRFAPHFHMPLQSGNNKQLRMMRRRYRRELYADRVKYIKERMPHCCIGVDVIVGFPGETHTDFLETYQFINELDISYLHVFTYSERPNTPAIELVGKVPVEERRRRNEMLRILSEKKRHHFYRQFIGQVRPVLFESNKSSGKLSGFTDNYIKIESDYHPRLINSIRKIPLQRINEQGLVEVNLPQ